MPQKKTILTATFYRTMLLLTNVPGSMEIITANKCCKTVKAFIAVRSVNNYSSPLTTVVIETCVIFSLTVSHNAFFAINSKLERVVGEN